MKKTLRVLASLLALSFVTGQALAASANGISIRNGYVRGLPPNVHNTSAYMTIINRSDSDLILTGAHTTVADSVTIHNTVNRNGQMTMEHVMSAVVPAHGELKLESGGMHLMLMGLHSSPKSGDSVKLSLEFKDAFVISLDLPVVSVLDE